MATKKTEDVEQRWAQRRVEDQREAAARGSHSTITTTFQPAKNARS